MAAENIIHHTLAGSASGGPGQATVLCSLTRPVPQSHPLSPSPPSVLSSFSPSVLLCLLLLFLLFPFFFFPTRVL